MKIVDLCAYAPKSAIKAGEAIKDGKYMFFTSSDDESKRYSDYQHNCEAIIMGTGGNATLHYYNGKFSTSTDCVVLLPNESIRCKFLYYFFLHNIAVLEKGFKGAGLKHTNKNYINNIGINTVPDIETQDKVIKALDLACNLVRFHQQQLKKFDELVKSRFIEMFGDPVQNTKGWPIRKLSECIQFLTSGSRGWAKYFTDEGEYFITIKNVKNCRITLDDVQHIVPPNNAEAKRTKVREGDLLISITADLGRTGVVTREIAEHGGYINQHLTCIRIDQKVARPLYVAYYMESEAGKSQFRSKNQSAVKAGLNFNAINSLRFMLPPIELQDSFIDFIKQVDKSKFVIQQALDKAQLLFDSLMQKYFG